jgi:hypothetical protein
VPLCPDFARIAARSKFLCRGSWFARNAASFEKIPGSDLWWIRFKVDGMEHREKVGRRGDAIKLYKIQKTDILRGAKMPANMKDKGVRFSVLALGSHQLAHQSRMQGRSQLQVQNETHPGGIWRLHRG